MKEKNSKKEDFGDCTIVADPFGSYTGRPEDQNEVPVQDADDL